MASFLSEERPSAMELLVSTAFLGMLVVVLMKIVR
jgi:hypothetical protein